MVSVMRLLRDNAAQTLINPVPVLAILVLYGFGRLPIGVAVLVGTIGSVFSMFGSRLTNMHEPALRTIIYLFVANGLGVLLARSIELRERHLFHQRRVIEEAHAQLELRTRAVEKASSEKTRLMAAVSHDLRQPMLSASIHAEVLVQRLDAGNLEAVRRQAGHVLESVKALGDTLEHLLMAARYQAGTERVKQSWVSIHSVLRRVDDLFRTEAEQRGLELRVRYPREEILVRSDEQVLLRALCNLVANAVKFTEPREGRRMGVLIRCFYGETRCVIRVADTGKGIESEFLERVWEPFFRVACVGEEGRQSGDGLGLYLVKQSLEKLEGHSIEVRSRIKHGTRFALAITGVKIGGQSDERESTLRAASTLPVGALQGTRVVLIEDDPDVRSAIETQFEAWGIASVSGDCVSGVLRNWKLFQGPVYAIVADFHLRSHTDGIDAIAEVRQNIGYCAPAVLITAEMESERLRQQLPVRTRLLSKPFNGANLIAALSSTDNRE
jgi:signal transduction histidine kinase